MRLSLAAIVVGVCTACGSAKPSLWEPRLPREGPQTMCSCDGVVREPRPDEASTPDDPRVVLAMCEGRVYDCRPFTGGGGGWRRNQLD